MPVTILRKVTVSGGTVLRAANNLGDVADAATSRTNLGLGTGSSPQFSSVGVGGAAPGSNGLKIFGTTASTSTTTGALQVSGGVGVAGALFTGGNISTVRAANSFITSESTVNGAASELIAKGLNSVGVARQANLGINRFADDVFSISDGTTERLRIGLTTGNMTAGGSITTSAPTGGAGAWELGVANAVTPTSPNRTITVEIGGTVYYLHAKTTND